jgi:Mn-dependent DtxR family transcriptional regulator
MLRQSGEDYLETILILRQKGAVRSVDIANEMSVSKPSVSRAVGILKREEYISIDEDGYITFTDKGKQKAEEIYERHVILKNWLTGIGVDEKTAAADACSLEHAFSQGSFEKLKEHIEKYHK